MKILNLFLLLVLSLTAISQVKQTPIAAKDIPISIKYLGHVINSARFTDKQGDYLIFTTETGLVNVKDTAADMVFQKADLYAYCYKMGENKPTLYWQMHDFVPVCPVHVTANYIPNTFAITDLDNNGIAEVWLMYLTGCRGDPSPGSLKIIMHEGSKKYAVRGSNRISMKYADGKTHVSGGDYKLEDNFKDAPETFKKYAQTLWQKHMNEDN